jgi:hypothetical protein
MMVLIFLWMGVNTSSISQAHTLFRPLSELNHGPLSLSVAGAFRAAAANNEALLLNPAAMALPRRYQFALVYGLEQSHRIQQVATSVIDSRTSELAVGMSYARGFSSPFGVGGKLDRWALGFAWALNEKLALGMESVYFYGPLALTGEKQHIANSTLGSLWRVGDHLRFAIVYHHIVPKFVDLMPPQLAFGSAVVFPLFKVMADSIWHLRVRHRDNVDVQIGGEVFLWQLLSLRTGYAYASGQSRPSERHHWHAGLGVVRPEGAIQMGVATGLAPWRFRDMLMSMEFYL